jgi:tripartite-type tricarboxylate transporter receptor subunit TctC
MWISRTITVLAVLMLSAKSFGDDAYPSRPVRIIYPSGAGTSGDARARLIAEKLSARLGQRFVVENKPGAATTLGTRMVANAKPDGYVLLATFTPAFPVGPLLYRDAGYDPVDSFTPIAMFARGSPFLVVHPAVPARTVKELVALAKANRGTLTFAHAGLGNATHLPAELFRRNASIDLLYISYKSEADALVDVLSGQVSAGFFYTAVAVPQIKAGKLRALAVARMERNPAAPDVPTMTESGYPGCEFRATMYLLGPAGVPDSVVSRLNAEISAVMQMSEVRSQYAATGAEPVHGTLAEVRSLLEHETEVNVSLLRALNVNPKEGERQRIINSK